MNKKIPVLLGVVILVIAISAWLLSMKAKPSDMASTTPNQTEVSPNAESINATIKGPLGVAEREGAQYMVTKDGMTLYVNVKDENQDQSIDPFCDSKCEAVWPPYLFDETVTVDQNSDPLLSKINVFERSDGQKQYAIGTQPLYTYVGDINAGDAKGLGIGNGWMVAKP